MLHKLFCLFILGGLLSMGETDRADLFIEVDNIRQDMGTIWVGIYDKEANFLVKEKAIILGEAVRTTGRLTVQVSDLPRGEYAVALFHDINGNGELDVNFLGIPTEPFAFSGQPGSRWRLPRFEEVKFNFVYPNQVLNTRLRKWNEK